MTLKAVELNASGRQAASRVYRAQPAGRFSRDNFGALEPPRLVSIMRDARDGNLEDFADLCSYAVRTDPTLRSLVITRIAGVAGADIEVAPGPHRPEEEGLANAAADFVREAHERVEEWEDRFADLLWGTFLNVGVLENVWRPERDAVWGDFAPVLTRDLRYRGDYDLQARTYADEAGEASSRYHWVSLREHPHKFTVNTPRNISERPTLTGEMFPVLWPWLFKRWIEKDGLDGFARLANGLLYRNLPENTDQNVVNEALSELENIGGQGVAVFKSMPGVPPIAILEMSKDPGATMRALVDYYNAELAKAILGSGLNVEVGNTGGNRALGESQFSTTILPRLIADSKRALGAVRRDWVRPLLMFNRDKFGGRMPPIPYLIANVVPKKVENTASVGVTQMAVNAGVLTKDELRGMAGLEPLPEGQGGADLVTPMLPGGGAPMSDVPEDALPLAEDKQGRARVEHQAGGEWAVVDEDGKLLDIFARKSDAVEYLRKLLLGEEDEEAGVVHVEPGGEPGRPLARSRKKPAQLRLALDSTPTASASRSPLAMALRRRSDDPEP